MAHDTLAEQMVVEHGMFKHIIDGLQLAIHWQPDGDDIARKLSTIRFISQSLQRHLDRLLALEEYDGYMETVVKVSPQLGKRVDALRREHDQFRKTSHRVLHRLENVSPTDQAAFRDVCAELLTFLADLDKHTQKEVHLLQEAFERDSGGEG